MWAGEGLAAKATRFIGVCEQANADRKHVSPQAYGAKSLDS